MLLGTYTAKFAAKRRVAIPALLRRSLGDSFILAKWYEGCLVLVAKAAWQALLERLTGGQKVITIPIRDTERFIFGSAYETEPDEQGRIVIPERLAEYATLGEELFFVGLGDRVEIWDKAIWEEKEKKVAREAAGYLEELAKTQRK
jgi:MraZ protein